MKKTLILFTIFSTFFSIDCKNKDNFINDATKPDNIPPIISINSPSNGLTYGSGNLIISGTASDNLKISSVKVSIDNGPFSIAATMDQTNWVYYLNTSSLTTGSHSITAKAFDIWDNTSTSSIAININNSIPLAELSGQPSLITNATDINIIVGGSDIVSYQFKIDTGSWSSEILVATNITASGLSEGSHTLQVRGKNSVLVWQDETAATSYTWSITTEKVWTHPASIDDYITPLGESFFTDLSSVGACRSQVAMDNNGNIIIVWQFALGYSQVNGEVACYKIFKSEYRGGVWTHPASINDYINPQISNLRMVFDAKVAMDNNGNAIIVWEQTITNNARKIFKSEYRGGVWVHPASINDYITPSGETAAVNPQVAMDNNGNAIIVWQHAIGFSGDGYKPECNKIFKCEYRNGTWTYPASNNDYINQQISDMKEVFNVKVTMNNNGKAIIIWEQEGSASSKYRHRIFISESQ